jgi:SAM-dependent methyltransferase
MAKGFSHVENFTGYMAKVYDIAIAGPAKQKVLDIPAGNGLLSRKIREQGHEVVSGDINQEDENYVYVDMSKPLPFDDDAFDTVICLEGLEHLLNPAKLIEEFCRIVKPGGRIIISLPNVQNLYSRFKFICTGTFFQFNPSLPTEVGKKEMVDLGHISSLSYVQLRYLFSFFGADLLQISGDKFKKKILLPFLSLFLLIGYFWLGNTEKSPLRSITYDGDRNNLFNKYLLYSRSLILVFQKQ